MEKELVSALFKMREAQNIYWNIKSTYHFTEMRRAENVVDRLIDKLNLKAELTVNNEPEVAYS